MHTLFIMLALSIAVAPTMAAEPSGPTTKTITRSPRVRAGDARSGVLLTEGLERSETIRTLVTQLQRRDVIVYIEMQPALKKRLAGTLTWVGATPTHRYVRISLSPDLGTEIAIATLGHELQHALEVANAAEIVSDRTLERFYRAHGDSNRAQANGWDTEAARVAGDVVRRELANSRSARVAETIQQFDPNDWLVVYRRTRGMLPP
jgi:hypothetical protein